MNDLPSRALQLRSLVRAGGQLEVSLVRSALPKPGPDEVLLRVDASPINPSDLGLLFGPADLAAAVRSERDGLPVLTAPVPAAAMEALAGRVGNALPVGNEGAGVVVAAGSSPRAQALLGRKVAALGGAMYAQYRAVAVDQCLVLPDGAMAAEGASAFVNPLTALGMVETMRREGHAALVHTAAASNLGLMLNRLCLSEGVGLVNIVRKPAQVEVLKAEGAAHVVDSSAPDFLEALAEAIAATGATLAFDAIGGGRLAGRILGAMEASLDREAPVYSRYGSPVHKQVYVYGGLDTGPTELVRSFGMAWGIGGWLMFSFLQKIGPQATEALKRRVAEELTTTFASRYAGELTLADVLDPACIAVYARRATGEKFLIRPNPDA